MPTPLTLMSDDALIQEARERGYDGRLVEPFTPEARGVVRKIVSELRSERPEPRGS